MINKDIKYLCFSDIHFGSKRNTTKEIVSNLDVYFDNYRSTSQFIDLDLIVIVGDMFDTLLDCASEDIHIVTIWLSKLMKFCEVYDISLRILEGTPSHDWKQSKIAETLTSVVNSKIDFKYIETLFIEHHERLDIDILYVPDEWTADTNETYRQVLTLLKEKSLTQVDTVFLHGMFTYQLGNAPANIQKHLESNYLNITKHFINTGHIHTHSVYERIIAEGSFDRLSHNEEEPKGGVVCVISKDHGNSFYFVENKLAKTFKTIIIKNGTLDAAMLKIDKVMSKVRDNSYIRIKAMKDHPVYVGFDQLKIRYPMCFFTKTPLDKEDDGNELISANVVTDLDYKPISITSENIVELLTNQIKTKYPVTEKQLLVLSKILN